MNTTMLFLTSESVLHILHGPFLMARWGTEAQGLTINLIPDDISYVLGFNPNWWPALTLLCWLVTLNMWSGRDVPFHKSYTLSELHPIHCRLGKREPWGRKSDTKSTSWFQFHNSSALWLNILGLLFPHYGLHETSLCCFANSSRNHSMMIPFYKWRSHRG